MEFFETVQKRHSYRGAFWDKPIPDADIRRILQAGISAPSGYNAQTTRFAVVTEPELLREIAALMETPVLQTAKAVIVPLSEYVPQKAGLVFETEDYAASVENILLAITSLGYAGVWMDGFAKLGDHAEKIAQILNAPENLHVRALIPFGVPQETWQQKEKKPFEERVQFNRF